MYIYQSYGNGTEEGSKGGKGKGKLLELLLGEEKIRSYWSIVSVPQSSLTITIF